MMHARITPTHLKRIVLIYWAAWLSVVVATNALEILGALGLLPGSFPFVSGNWRWINQVMDPLGVPRALQAVQFAGAIAWEALAAALFWRAVVTYRGRPLAQEGPALAACGVNLALWAAFQVLDEVFLAYPPEGVHRIIFLIQIATLLLLQQSTEAPRPADPPNPGAIPECIGPSPPPEGRVAPSDLPSSPSN